MRVEIKYYSGDGWWIRAAGRTAHVLDWSKSSEAYRRWALFCRRQGSAAETGSTWLELDADGCPT